MRRVKNPLLSQLEIETEKNFIQWKKHINKEIKQFFSSYIKCNFLIEIFWRVLEKIEVRKLLIYYTQPLTSVSILSNQFDEPISEVCWHIIGIHKSNWIFNDNKQELEESEDYKNKLVNDVIFQIHNRNYGAHFFRKKDFIGGDRFVYFPVPYALFCECIKGVTILIQKITSPYKDLYVNIFNKCLAGLFLLESNLIDSAYSVCRGTMELFLKLLLTKYRPECLAEHNEFVWYEIQRNCCFKRDIPEFNKKYKNRKQLKQFNKVEYMHFGWVDWIKDFNESISDNRPYCIDAVIEYLSKNLKDEWIPTLQNIKYFITLCHPYVHGNVGNTRYQILHYFEITLMMYHVVHNTYIIACQETKTDMNINQTNICDYVTRHYKNLERQYNSRSTKKFNSYYKNPK